MTFKTPFLLRPVSNWSQFLESRLEASISKMNNNSCRHNVHSVNCIMKSMKSKLRYIIRLKWETYSSLKYLFFVL